MGDFERALLAELQRGFTTAGVYYASRLRGYLNTSQPYKRSPRTGKHHGLSPSLPGQYPKKLSGELQRSITWKLDKVNMVLTVGSNLGGYPAFLELGTRFMQPRPWLTLSWNAERNTIVRMIVG